MPVPHVRVTSQINCGNVTLLSQKRPPLATMAKSAIDKKWNNTFVTVNNDFWVTRDAICQWYSLVTSSLVKIIGKSPHS